MAGNSGNGEPNTGPQGQAPGSNSADSPPQQGDFSPSNQSPASSPGGDGQQGQGPAAEPPHAPPPQAPRTDWRDRRIGEQQQRIRELRAQLEQFQRTTVPQTPGAPPPAQEIHGQPPPSQAEIDRQINERAYALAQQQEFNRRCNEVADAGRTQYADFDVRVGKLVGLVDGNDPQAVANYNQFLSAALETGEASRLIHALGGDLDEASRILGLTPIRMAVELTKMASRPPSEMSNAPRPLNPIASQGVNNRATFGADDPSSDNLSTEEWMRRRNEQIAARRNNAR